MSDSLIPEKPAFFSPSLAATIGLEEAILLQYIDSLTPLGQRDHQGLCWLEASINHFAQALPFWSPAAIRRLLLQLSDLGMVILDTTPQSSGSTFKLCINQKQNTGSTHQSLQTEAAANQAANNVQPNTQDHLGATRIPANWQADSATLSLLQQQGIDPAFAKQFVSEFVMYWQERSEVSYAWSSKFYQHVMRQWQNHRQQAAAKHVQQSTHASIDKVWEPSFDAIEILERMGINRNFIDDAIPEFILYWQERGDKQSTWNSKFVAHVKRQWARFTHTLKHDTEPRPITANWQPDIEVFDVLAIANIDEQFARDLIPEFVLFWRDKNDLHHSWNTKFLQHVKFHWARRNDANKNSRGDAIERLTDRSWAADII